MKESRIKVGGILTKYERISGASSPDTVEQDFKTIVKELPPGVLEPHIATAFASPATPDVQDIAASWYKKAKKSDRKRLLQLLRESGAISGNLVSLPVLDAEVDLVSSDIIASAVASAAKTDPDITKSVAGVLLDTPKALLGLDSDVQAMILKTLADSKSQVLESMEQAAAKPREVAEIEKTSPPPQQNLEPAARPRYVCVNLFEEDKGKEWTKAGEFSTDQLFREGLWCLAEVSVRSKPQGVAPKQPRRPLREPRQSGPVDIMVTAQSKDFDISPRVSKLVLPTTGDSTEQALLRIKPLRCSRSADDKLGIRFRLFYKFNLLQTLTLTGGALPEIEYDGEPRSWQPPGLELGFPDVQSDANDFDLMPPRALHIEVTPDGPQYEMVFTFRRPNQQDEVVFTASVALTSDHLADEIAGARKTLFHISSSETLGTQLEGTGEYEGQLTELAARGEKLWSLLFDRGSQEEITSVGEFLKTNPLPEGSTIQVSVDRRASSFVFAWSLLYDKPRPPYQPSGFWGIRYVIEQRLVLPGLPALAAPNVSNVEIGAMYWQFAQTPEQQKYFSDLISPGDKVRFAKGGPIDEAAKALECIASCSSHIIYFFTHGYTRLPDGERYGVTVQDFLRTYDALPQGSPIREAWKLVAEDIENKQFQSDESWIELSAGRILLSKLYGQIRSLPLRPFVLLNMCDSAQVTPALSQSFIDFFITRGARAVIGTECSIRPVFADFAGRELLRALLMAVPVGEALRRLRVQAVEQNKNLLGLAYTIFGSTDAVLSPALLPAQVPPGGSA